MNIIFVLSFILFIGIASCDGTNLIQNPGFDEAYTSCSSIPSWTEVNDTNLLSPCNGESYWEHSSPNSVFATPTGPAGLYQDVSLDQKAPVALTLTTWVWLVALGSSAEVHYTSLPFFGVIFNITYQDGTQESVQIAYPHGGSTGSFVKYTNVYTPTKSIETLRVILLIIGNHYITAMFDDISIVEGSNTTSATSPPANPTVPANPTTTPVQPTTISPARTCIGEVQLVARSGAGSVWTTDSTNFKIFDVVVQNLGTCEITSSAFPYFFVEEGTITQSWGLRLDSAQGYGSVVLPSAIEAGNSYGGAGFIIANYTTFSSQYSAEPVMCSSC